MRVLLDVLGQARHEVLSIFVQGLALLLVSVRGVHDGGRELGGRRVAGSVLGAVSARANGRQWQQLHTRRLAASGLSATTSFTRRAVAVKVRTAGREQPAERTAWPNGRPTAWRRAIMYVLRVVWLRAAGRRPVGMSSSMFVASCRRIAAAACGARAAT